MSAAGEEALVSIALCTYNGARFLSQQLDSLLAQTHRNLEVVAADDCSSDATAEILHDYARRDPRVQVLTATANRGVTRNFEFALEHCRGHYIAPSDQDDIWLPEKLSTLLDNMADAALSYCDSELIDEQGRLLGKRVSDQSHMLSTTDPAIFAFGNSISGHALLFRSSLLPKVLPVPEGFFHDWWIAAVAAANGGVVYCPRVLVHYRQHGNSITDMLRARRMPSAQRTQGFRAKPIRDIGLRIAALAGLSNAHAVFLNELLRLWRRHESQWFSFGLSHFMLRNRKRLLALLKGSQLKVWRKCARHILGLRARRFMNRQSYGP